MKYVLTDGETRIEVGATAPVHDPEIGGWRCDGLVVSDGTRAYRVEADPDAPAYRTAMTPIRFKAQFTIPERLAIGAARAYAPAEGQVADPAKVQAKQVLDILFGDLDDPRLETVDVADPAVIQGIDFCTYIGIVTAARAATIKLGIAE